MNSTRPYRSWADIDLHALTFNLKRIRSLAGRREVIGVIKADAYGHGLFGVAQALAQQGVRTFAVANLIEAQIASKAVAEADVLILGPLLAEEYAELVTHSRWTCTLSSEQEFQALEKEAASQRKKVRAHLKLDTGMGRIGALPNEMLKLYEKISDSRWVKIASLFSHLSSADSDHPESLAQLQKFQNFTRELEKRGFSIPPIHIQNSAGTLRLTALDIADYVRPGLSLYGVASPLSSWQKQFGKEPLHPVLSWKTRVALIRDIPAGTSISYDRTHRTRTRTKVAVLSAGYADGIFRKLSNRGQVLIGGKRCPILGRVTMDMIMVDISKVKNVKWGDTATLIGKNNGDGITAQEFAQWAETSPYEVLCNISKRVPRIIV
jgi:alanine racemase